MGWMDWMKRKPGRRNLKRRVAWLIPPSPWRVILRATARCTDCRCRLSERAESGRESAAALRTRHLLTHIISYIPPILFILFRFRVAKPRHHGGREPGGLPLILLEVT